MVIVKNKMQEHSIMNLQIRDFIIQDYDKAISLWNTGEGIGLSSADRRESIEQFLKRNHGLSKVLVDDGTIVATVLCGHDGRRGYLYHLYVAASYRSKGLGKKLVDACLFSLKKKGIQKCHVFVFGNNNPGKNFWKAVAWNERGDITVFSKDL